jgi:hypothetical protein
VLSAESVKY